MQITLKYTEEMQDGRMVVSSSQKDEIRSKYRGGVKMKLLADEYGIAENSVYTIIYPEKTKQYKDRINTIWKDYYNKEKHRVKMAKYRAKKRSLGFTTSKKPV